MGWSRIRNSQSSKGISDDNRAMISRLSFGYPWTSSSVLLAFSIAGSTLILSQISGCAQKGITKPYSQIARELSIKGQEQPTVEEERARFLAVEEAQKTKLLQLIKQRASANYRDSNYRLGAGDEVEINVFDVPELNLTVSVRQSGFIALPLIGGVKVVDMTEAELLEDLRKRLSTYVRDPQVSVFISRYGSQKVAVMGAVSNPGTFPLQKGANSLLELISQAGGVTSKAGNLVNFIPAEVSGVGSGNNVEARAQLSIAASQSPALVGGGLQVYLDQVLGTNGGVPLEIPVRGGDMIVVPEAGKIMVEGEVEKPGSYDLGQQMTMLSGLASAGGLTYSAKIDEVEIVREVGMGERAHLVVDLEKLLSGEEKDVRLRNGDLIRVPSDSGRRTRSDTVEAIGKMLNFGVGGSFNLAN